MGLGLVFVLMFRGLDSLIDDNCEQLLATLPATFFEEYASCSKYTGYTEMWNGTGWQLGSGQSFVDAASGEPFVADLGDMAICNPKSLASFAWEINPYTRPSGGVANFYGCLNADPVDGCCEAIKDQMHAFDYGIVAMFVLLFIMMFAGIYGSLYLRYETTIIGHILIHPYAKRVFIGMKLVILSACIGLPFFFTGDNCGGIPAADLNAAKNLLPRGPSQSVAIVVLPPSCFNGILDGSETDIDCGGDCDELCGVRNGCNDAADCSLGLLCVAQAALSPDCFDRRCVTGQTSISLFGVCAHPTAEDLCQDTNQNYRETDTDCGGPDCRGLAVPKLCDLNAACRRNSDCKGSCDGTFTADGTSPCSDVPAFAASGAQIHCVADGCTFNPRQCVQGTCSAICNAELAVLAVPVPPAENICGGACPACSGGTFTKSCAVDSDCVSNSCYRPDITVAGECASYYNGQQDGSETDTDCGGDRASDFPCDRLRSCVADGDCRTGNCGGTCTGTLTADSSACDAVSAFMNTGTAADCPTSDGCTYTDNKCASLTPLITCADTTQNYLETDLDCGGDSCVTVGATCATDKHCRANSDCTAGACSPGANGVCFGCGDGAMNGDETDVDCGGATCNRKCSDTPPQVCVVNSDCASNHCFGPRDAATCVSYFNNAKDGDETDVDCGGSAAEREGRRCGTGLRCGGNFDCQTSVCGDGIAEQCTTNDAADAALCAAVIGDNLLNTTACTAVTKTDDSHPCTWSSVCRTNTPLEVCTDGQQTFPETDVDCGGEACRTVGQVCADGLQCIDDADCASTVCDFYSKQCVSCTNGNQDGEESGVDCGGSRCSSCADASGCNVDGDCVSGSCFASGGSGVCVSCNNGFADGGETGVDCGGQCGKGCAIGGNCQTTDDCAGGVCDTQDGPLLCRALTPAESCANSIKDGQETDVDCGGAACATVPARCAAATADATAQVCLVGTDCASNICYSGTCASCSNALKDGDESDIDCGGATGCAKCNDATSTTPAQVCVQDNDCRSSLCFKTGNALTGICVSYLNAVQDGDETCIDGGGSGVETCAIDEGCQADTDCSTNKCCLPMECVAGYVQGSGGNPSTTCPAGCQLAGVDAAETCTAPVCNDNTCRSLTFDESCRNGVQDGSETDLDCGGTGCATVGKQCEAATSSSTANSCLVDTDCNGSCMGNICVSCANLIKDGDETDIDCGGACGKCDHAQSTVVASDTTLCALTTTTDFGATAGTCALSGTTAISCVYSPGTYTGSPADTEDTADSCTSTVQASAAQTCGYNPDCQSGACYVHTLGLLGVCVSDRNALQDGDESCVDGGGSMTGNTCNIGQTCTADSDCDIKCQLTACPTCATGYVQGSDGVASTCAVGCTLTGADAAEICTGTPSALCAQNTCRALTLQESCNNGMQDGSETDLDCGGEGCATVGKQCLAATTTTAAGACLIDADCNGRCAAVTGTLTCVSCSNIVLDGDETDVDCGGSFCGKCNHAVTTATPTDTTNCLRTASTDAGATAGSCASVGAFAGVCSYVEYMSAAVPDSCTSIEVTTAAQQCAHATDCQSSECYGIGNPPFFCVAYDNSWMDGDETCIDGGGAAMRAAQTGLTCGVGGGCQEDADCSTAACDTTVTPNVCRSITAAESCANSIQDGQETDVDCGGAACFTVPAQCGSGQGCYKWSDCQTGLCFDMTMAVPAACTTTGVISGGCTCVSCYDGIKNGDESDIDCGGSSCRSCDTNSVCLVATDCLTGNCAANSCQPTADQLCRNDATDTSNGETDHDCGGPSCGQCADGNTCLLGSDCGSNVCTDIGTVAVPNSVCTSCGNGEKDGVETDIDCGSIACPVLPCVIDQLCKTGADCSSGNCDNSAPSADGLGGTHADYAARSAAGVCELAVGCGICMPPTPATTCSDTSYGQSETCIDGGGVECTALGKLCPTCGGSVLGNRCSCAADSDCDSRHCSSTSTCFSCTNGVKDAQGDETDVDCGGPCNTCAVGLMCALDSDCSSNQCSNIGTAAAPILQCTSCTNGITDGLETDIDCGDAACPGQMCAAGQMCAVDADCASGSCDTGGTNQCVAPTPDQTCNDGVKGQQETCIDGGGASCRSLRNRCPVCPTAADGISVVEGDECSCRRRSDCASRKCASSGFCFSCTNGLKDGDETGIDCGGPCNTCAVGQLCSSQSDCSSGSCQDWSAASDGSLTTCSSCTNGIKEGLETDIDCGASACPNQLCQLNQICLTAADCASQNCVTDTNPNKCAEPTPAATCNDQAMGQLETCTDGGGVECLSIGNRCPVCPTAADGVSVVPGDECSCAADADCESRKCSIAGSCFSCSNGIKDGDETAVDCGGPCNTCAVGQECALDADCSTGSCTDVDTTGGAPDLQCTSCTNGIVDGLETDIDCGAAACPTPCSLSQACLTNADCASQNCDTATSICAVPAPSQTCADGVQGQLETCTDGGGVECQSIGALCVTCAQTAGAANCGCAVDGDCAGAAYCHTGPVAPGCFSCGNGVRDGDETGIDCGGTRCSSCPVGQSCTADQDCSSNTCMDIDTTGATPNLKCTSCTNGAQDGLETDVDCGATACSQPCQQGSTCDSAADCVSGNCAESCFETAAVSDPTDRTACSNADLSGSNAASSTNCAAIMKVADATAAACTYTEPGTCAPPLPSITCNDGVQGQLETDVDCGGAECTMLGKSCTAFSATPSNTAQMCLIGTDCDSGLCTAQLCTSCSNGAVDGLEADVDCGGTSCSQCSDGDECTFNADCSSGMCYMPCSSADAASCAPQSTCMAMFGVSACVETGTWDVLSRPVVAAMGTCVSATNGIADGMETDVDCGGPATQCTKDQICMRDGDCASGNCNTTLAPFIAAGGRCNDPAPADTCADSAMGELETDVDCGGTPCLGLGLACGENQGCLVNADCLSNSCGASLTCSSCGNGAQDGDETGIDCGGTTCAACGDRSQCLVDADCQSGSCSDYWALPGGIKTCIRQGDMTFGTLGSVDLAGGASVFRALWIDQQNVPVHPLYPAQTAACSMVLQLESTNGTIMHFEDPTPACMGANAVAQTWGDSADPSGGTLVTLDGSLSCISEMISYFGVDTSCTTPWGFEGDHTTGTDDLTWAQVNAQILDQSQCAMYALTGTPSTTLGFRIVGRMQIEVIGYVLPASCKADDGAACDGAAISGATITGAVHPCHLGVDTCADNSPFARLSCTQLIGMGMMTCSMDVGTTLGQPENVGVPLEDFCKVACDNCPDVTSAFETTSGTVLRTNVGPLSGGAFESTVAFSPTEAKLGASAAITVMMAAYTSVTITVPLQNGVVDVGNVYLPEEPPKNPAPVQGICIDYWPDTGGAAQVTSATLQNGLGWAGANPALEVGNVEQALYADGCPACAAPPCAACPNGVDNEFTYTQSNTQMGTKTLTCTMGNSTSTQFVASNGDAVTAINAAEPMLMSNPAAGFVAVLRWADLSKPATFGDTTDLEFFADFGVDTDGDGVDDGAGCRLDVANPACGGARHILDGPLQLPGPFTNLAANLAVLTEAIALDRVYSTVYTFYSYNRGAIDQGLTCASETDPACTQIVDMTLELFGSSGTVLDIRTGSQNMGMPYTRLFCIDARVSPPVIRSALATSRMGAPARCTSCPC